MFRRRREAEDFDDALELDEEPAAELPLPVERPQGPWDVADLPETDQTERVDFGALRVAVAPGHELRVDLDPQAGTVVALTLAAPESIMQVMAFAAPRTTGIWADVRAEIAASLTGSGAQAQETTGPYGPELRAQVPTDQPGQLVPARFLGVDGPRWFLRAMVQGRAAVEPDADADLIASFRDVVVDRGSDAMAVRDPLPLRLPKDVQQQIEAAQESAAGQQGEQSLQLPERGPEITETR